MAFIPFHRPQLRGSDQKCTDCRSLASEVCEVDEKGKKPNCGTVKDDAPFEDYAKKQGNKRRAAA